MPCVRKIIPTDQQIILIIIIIADTRDHLLKKYKFSKYIFSKNDERMAKCNTAPLPMLGPTKKWSQSQTYIYFPKTDVHSQGVLPTDVENTVKS